MSDGLDDFEELELSAWGDSEFEKCYSKTEPILGEKMQLDKSQVKALLKEYFYLGIVEGIESTTQQMVLRIEHEMCCMCGGDDNPLCEACSRKANERWSK